MKSKLPQIRIHTRKLLWSMIMGMLVLFISYETMNVYWPWTGGEKMKLQVCEWAKQSIRKQDTGSDMFDSVMMVNVHYDKVFALEKVDNNPRGYESVTDHRKLLTFLRKLKEYDNYKYIMLDLYIEKNIAQECDSELISLIESMDRIVVPIPLGGAEKLDKRLVSHAAMAKYGSTLWESDFVKYPYYSDGVKSIPLKMYEEVTGRTISDYKLLAWDRGIARKNVLLTYEFREHVFPYHLGKGILGGSLAGIQSEGILNKPQKFKDKYILIGDFNEDSHDTFLGKMSGTAINFNAFISLLHGKHRPGLPMILVLYVIFTGLVYLTLTCSKAVSGGFWSYGTWLLIFCIAVYLLFNEVYEILVLSVVYSVFNWFIKHNVITNIKAMWKKIISIVFLLSCTFLLPTANAQEYKIIDLVNCSSIKIGKRVLYEEDKFNFGEPVYWKSADEAMRLKSNAGEIRMFAQEGFIKYKAKSLKDFLAKEKGLAGRGVFNGTVHYRDRDYYLVDSLHFKARNSQDSTLIAEAVWSHKDGQQMVTRIQRTEDGKYYVITPEILGNHPQHSILLSIRERDEDYDYIDNVYRDIPIIFIPRKDK